MENFIDKDDKKQVLNKLNEEVMILSKKSSEIKNKIKKLSDEKNSNDRIIKNYLGLISEYKYLKKIIAMAILTLGTLIPILSFSATLGVLKTLIIIASTVSLAEITGLSMTKLVFKNTCKKFKIKNFDDENISFEEMKENVAEKNKVFNEEVESLEIQKNDINNIKNLKKEEIEKIKESYRLSNNDLNIKNSIKYEDDSKEKKVVKYKKK